MSKFDEKGRELPDPTPIAVPAHFKRPPTLQEQIRSMVRSEELRRLVESRDMETFEEADDFDVGEDFDPRSPHELVFDPELGKEIPQEVAHELKMSRASFDEEVKKAKSTPKAKLKKQAKTEEDPPLSDEE